MVNLMNNKCKGWELKHKIMEKFNIKDKDIRKWPKEAKQIWDNYQNERAKILNDFQENIRGFVAIKTHQENILVTGIMNKVVEIKIAEIHKR